jgi:hypothetical protein
MELYLHFPNMPVLACTETILPFYLHFTEVFFFKLFPFPIHFAANIIRNGSQRNGVYSQKIKEVTFSSLKSSCM